MTVHNTTDKRSKCLLLFSGILPRHGRKKAQVLGQNPVMCSCLETQMALLSGSERPPQWPVLVSVVDGQSHEAKR